MNSSLTPPPGWSQDQILQAETLRAWILVQGRHYRHLRASEGRSQREKTMPLYLRVTDSAWETVLYTWPHQPHKYGHKIVYANGVKLRVSQTWGRGPTNVVVGWQGEESTFHIAPSWLPSDAHEIYRRLRADGQGEDEAAQAAQLLS